MARKILISLSLLIILIAIAGIIFQLFFRFEIVEIGSYDLKYDRLKSEIYFRNVFVNPTNWEKFEPTNDFRKAKALLIRNKECNTDQLENEISGLKDGISGLKYEIEYLESKIRDLETEIRNFRCNR